MRAAAAAAVPAVIELRGCCILADGIPQQVASLAQQAAGACMMG
jgi:hypothetical protein